MAALVLLGLAYVAAGLLTLHDDHSWGDDWAQYVGHARNLALGRPYADTGYLFNPAAPGIGPAVSQPGLPVLLAPVYRLFGFNLLALKAAVFLLLVAGIVLAAKALTDTVGPSIALLSAALFAMHPAVLWLRQVVLTESPYICFTFLAIVLAKERWRNPLPSRIFAYSVLTGLALFAAYATRLVAEALVVAIVINDLLKRRHLLLGTLPLLATFAAGFLVLRHTAALADYSNELSNASRVQSEVSNLVSTLWWRANSHLSVLAEAIPMPLKLSKAAAGIALILALIGALFACMKAQAAASSRIVSRVLAVAANCPLEALYLGAYLAALIWLPVYSDLRLLLPVLPILIALALFGGSELLKRFGWYTPAVVAPLLACVFAYLVALHFNARNGTFSMRADLTESENGAFCVDCKDMYAFIATRTPAGARFAFAKPRTFALLAHRGSLGFSRRAPQASTWAQMYQAGIDYVVVPRVDHILFSAYPEFLSWQTLADRADVTVVFSNPTFRVYRVNWSLSAYRPLTQAR